MTNPHQKKIIERYYEHHDTIQSNKLSDLVSEIWLAEDEKTLVKLWGKAQVALMRLGADAQQVANVVAQRDVKALAKLVAQFDANPASRSKGATAAKEGGRGAASTKASDADQPRVPSLADGRTIKQALADRAAAAGYDSLEEPNLKRALKAFRKKLKSMRLDDESALGNRYVTSGRKSAITAITPPRQYPSPVWEKLVELGRLKRAGQGLYELPGNP